MPRAMPRSGLKAPPLGPPEAEVRAEIRSIQFAARGAVETLLVEAYERFKTNDQGKVADYIPALARTPRSLFGLCVLETNGAIHTAGDTEYAFSIQSISKPFVFALVHQAIGAEPARERIGVNSTGLPFNSVMAIELNRHRTMNPMVDAGAIATTSLAPGGMADAKWAFIRDDLPRFAGHPLEPDEEVYRSEAATNVVPAGICRD
jgi:glutaminase